MSSRVQTFYWHDYETFGTDPALDRPAQFAGVRTDQALEEIGDPLVIFCRPANDFLPQPGACLVTGITPQKALAEGVPEHAFIARIHEELARPGTCGVGYNSLRFDDEVTRYTLYRNFYDPYAREWQNGNSRWDIIDMVRTAYALRPEGIHWPLREDGLPSFRLEDLTAANGIGHESAHDALSDVRATIALARLLRERQPRLFDYVLNHRDKRSVAAQLDVAAMKPVLHVSGMFGARRSNIALIAPLAVHPVNRNEILCYDLAVDPSPLLSEDPAKLQQWLFTRESELPDGVERPGLKSVHLNKCPVLVTPKMADPETAARLGIDGDLCRRHLAALREQRRADPHGFETRIQTICQRHHPPRTDPDSMLYEGFFSESDKRVMDSVRDSSAEELAAGGFVFEDRRLADMLFRYRARNFPDSLNAQERGEWEEFRFARLTDPQAGGSIAMEAFLEDIESRLAADDLSEADRAVLNDLLAYSDTLLA